MNGAVRDAAELCQILNLPEDVRQRAVRATGEFPVFAPREFIRRIQPGDVRDPLLLQILPVLAECDTPSGFATDPVGDGPATRAPGLVHKYQGRVLLVTTGACAVHCRYCFRRHFPYHETPQGVGAWQPALQIIREDPSIEEVLLSGGDPLTLVDHQLSGLVGQLVQIPHLRRLRVHTRLPIMIPQRVTEAMLDWLCQTRLQPVMVLHANHAAELDTAVQQSIRRVAEAGVMLLNQTVLLRGINDTLEALVELSQRLLDCRVIPYYLHQLDRVQGAAHFETPLERGRQLVQEMAKQLPGYAVPRFVREDPGAASKTFLA